MKKVYQAVVEQQIVRKCTIVVAAEDEEGAEEKAERLSAELPLEEWVYDVKFTNTIVEEMDEEDLEDLEDLEEDEEEFDEEDPDRD